MNDTPPVARRELIALRLDQGQTVVATALAEEFAVSEDAIRRDLRALAAEGRCRRVYGGALPISSMSTSMAVRAAEDIDRKRTLARAAVKLLTPGEVIFLDNGSANLALAAELPDDLDLKVITNSVPIAAVLFERQSLDFMILGGTVNREVGGVIDASAVLAVQQLSIDRCFLGACALSVRHGACIFDAGDAAFKRALVGVSEAIVLMALTDKLETRAPHRVAPLETLDTLILEADAPQVIRDDLALGGARIILA
ncbi:MAG TPA: DeoR/GlpR family DNA-binding transcription regulator [Caulobacter sp.]|nr:DeoR/GlpR family DNA-binding transcription regulator [Caulobacter sp.]